MNPPLCKKCNRFYSHDKQDGYCSVCFLGDDNYLRICGGCNRNGVKDLIALCEDCTKPIIDIYSEYKFTLIDQPNSFIKKLISLKDSTNELYCYLLKKRIRFTDHIDIKHSNLLKIFYFTPWLLFSNSSCAPYTINYPHSYSSLSNEEILQMIHFPSQVLYLESDFDYKSPLTQCINCQMDIYIRKLNNHDSRDLKKHAINSCFFCFEIICSDCIKKCSKNIKLIRCFHCQPQFHIQKMKNHDVFIRFK